LHTVGYRNRIVCVTVLRFVPTLGTAAQFGTEMAATDREVGVMKYSGASAE
jgi:hypothetical protein